MQRPLIKVSSPWNSLSRPINLIAELAVLRFGRSSIANELGEGMHSHFSSLKVEHCWETQLQAAHVIGDWLQQLDSQARRQSARGHQVIVCEDRLTLSKADANKSIVAENAGNFARKST
jgi:hypothetical protein